MSSCTPPYFSIAGFGLDTCKKKQCLAGLTHTVSQKGSTKVSVPRFGNISGAPTDSSKMGFNGTGLKRTAWL